MEILINPPLLIPEVIDLFRASGLRRPWDDQERIAKMFANANLVLAAYDDTRLVGVCRALTDFSYVCYVSDLAVAPDYQQRGTGRALLNRVSSHLGDQVSLVLLSAHEATQFYGKLGFEKADNCFLHRRLR